MNIPDEILECCVRIMRVPKGLVVVEGTHQHGKAVAGFLALTQLMGRAPGDYLLRAHLLRMLYAWDTYPFPDEMRIAYRALEKKRLLTWGGSRLHLDSANQKSQDATPYHLRGAMLWVGEVFDKRVDQVDDLLRRSSGPVILATWTDNRSDAWMDRFAPTRIVLHHPIPKLHQNMLELRSHKPLEAYRQAAS